MLIPYHALASAVEQPSDHVEGLPGGNSLSIQVGVGVGVGTFIIILAIAIWRNWLPIDIWKATKNIASRFVDRGPVLPIAADPRRGPTQASLRPQPTPDRSAEDPTDTDSLPTTTISSNSSDTVVPHTFPPVQQADPQPRPPWTNIFQSVRSHRWI